MMIVWSGLRAGVCSSRCRGEAESVRGSSQVQIHHPSGQYQYVSRFKEAFLVALYEERDCRIYSKVRHLSTSKSRASEARRAIASIAHSAMEVG